MLVVLLIFLSLSAKAVHLNCPQRVWAEYKTNEVGSWSTCLSPSCFTEVTFVLTRNVNYQCENNDIEFQTEFIHQHWGNWYVWSNYLFRIRPGNLWQCTLSCNEEYVDVPFEYRKWSGWYWYDWSSLGELSFLNRNCDKLYWTSWMETLSCGTSAQSTSTRYCMDCYDEEINQKYCHGSISKNETCWPVWSEWSKAEDCISSGCHSTGERIRTRKCLYENESEALDVQLCSDDSPTKTETCANNLTDCKVSTKFLTNVTTPTLEEHDSTTKSSSLVTNGQTHLSENTKLSSQMSSDTSNSFNSNLSDHRLDSNSGLYIGIGVVGLLLLILCVSLIFVFYRRRKRGRSSQPANANLDLSPYDSAVASPSSGAQPNVYGKVPGSPDYDAAYSTVQLSTNQTTSRNGTFDPSPYESAVAGSMTYAEQNVYDYAADSQADDAANSTLHTGHVTHANNNLESSAYEFAAADTTTGAEASVYDVTIDVEGHDTAYSTLQMPSSAVNANVYSGMPDETNQENDYSLLAPR